MDCVPSRSREEIFADVEKTIHWLLAFAGMDMLKYPYSFKRLFPFQLNIFQATGFCAIYAYTFYQFRDDFHAFIFAICVMGIGAQGDFFRNCISIYF